MKVRQKYGGSLAFIFTTLVIPVLLGIALLAVCQLVFSTQEATSATDAAALNMAKVLTYRPTVNAVAIGVPEFAGLGDNWGNEFSLSTYNNAVAKTIQVALNAEEEKTGAAYASARHMKMQLDKLAAALSRKVAGSNELDAAFQQLSAANALRWGKNTRVKKSGQVKWLYSGVGEASNIYFDPESLSDEANAKLDKYLKKDGPKSPHGQYYLKGYEPIRIAGLKIEPIPVYPGQQPHLISHRDVSNERPGSHPLPNSFMVNSTLENPGTAALRQTAAAAIGVMQRAANLEEPAESQNCYIKIYNRPGLGPPNGEMVSDGDNDLFNKELFSPSRIQQSTNGVFTTDTKQMAAWIAYNNGRGRDPMTMGFNLGRMRIGNGSRQRATLADLKAIRALHCECTHTFYVKDMISPCRNPQMIRTWADNYRRWSVDSPHAENGLTAIERVKADCLAGRSLFCKSYDAPDYRGKDRHSGVRLFKSTKIYATPEYPIHFTQVGSPWQLIDQIFNRQEGVKGMSVDNTYPEKHEDAIRIIYRDARKIKPFATEREIAVALDSKKLDQGQALWLMNKGGRLVLTEDGPSEGPEGKIHRVFSVFSIAGKTFNAPGDAGYADAPFTWTDNGRPFDPSVDNMAELGNAHNNRAAGATESFYIQRGSGRNCLGQVVFDQIAFPCGLDCPN